MTENKKERIEVSRLIRYFLGLFIMTAGIAISVKSDLGVSPVSSIPYTMTRCWGIEKGVMQTVSDVTKIAFPKVKVAFDITMVVISLVTCLIVIHSIGSVGLGTIMSAVLGGVVLGQIMRLWAIHKKRHLSDL